MVKAQDFKFKYGNGFAGKTYFVYMQDKLIIESNSIKSLRSEMKERLNLDIDISEKDFEWDGTV